MTIECLTDEEVLHGEDINLVKLDVERAEIETLLGMRRIIHDQRPNLLVSAYHTPGHLYEIVDLIADWNLDYRFHLRVHEHNSFGVVLYAFQDRLIRPARPFITKANSSSERARTKSASEIGPLMPGDCPGHIQAAAAAPR